MKQRGRRFDELDYTLEDVNARIDGVCVALLESNAPDTGQLGILIDSVHFSRERLR